MSIRVTAVTAFVTVLAGCPAPSRPVLELAMTTSVQNSGLLAVLLPVFEQAAGIEIRVHAAGSGRALQMLSKGEVDAVISHSPLAELRLMLDHTDWRYRKLAHNWFVVVGPSADPAGVRSAQDAADAFRRIAESDATFVSRGDQSGTHERENASGKPPAGDPSLSGCW